MHRHHRLSTALAGAILALTTLAACGSDDDESSDTTVAAATSTSVAPEDVIVSDAEVKSGLDATVTLLETLAATPALADDAALADVEALWFSYEGTVKENDAGAYLDAEDALAQFDQAAKDGDGEVLTAAAAKFKAMAKAYLAKFPG